MPARPGALGPLAAVLASMTCVQVGAAVSVQLFDTFGVVGTTSLRLIVAALVLLALARPWRGWTTGRGGLGWAVALGLVSATMMVAFSQATARIPLGTAVAVEFCGPLAVAALSSRRTGRFAVARRLWWPLVAGVGVLALTRPWELGDAQSGRVWAGLGFAALAAVGWAGYIVLTAKVGRQAEGMSGLSVAVAAAALVVAPLGLVEAAPALGEAFDGSPAALRALAAVALAALLVPLLAYALELVALRRMDTGAFGVLMALEPAIGAAAGAALLAQGLDLWQAAGLALVTVAGAGAARGSARIPPSD